MIVPMIAPTAGATLLALGGWRAIHVALAGVGMLLLLAMLIGFAEAPESTRPTAWSRPSSRATIFVS
jgi:hypothetical protein